MSAVEVVGKQGRAVQVSLGSILLLLVGTGAFFASSSLLEFSVFFIIPVAYFTWFIHRKAGAMASAVSAAVTLWADMLEVIMQHQDSFFGFRDRPGGGLIQVMPPTDQESLMQQPV
jgi:hypothetical protein